MTIRGGPVAATVAGNSLPLRSARTVTVRCGLVTRTVQRGASGWMNCGACVRIISVTALPSPSAARAMAFLAILSIPAESPASSGNGSIESSSSTASDGPLSGPDTRSHSVKPKSVPRLATHCVSFASLFGSGTATVTACGVTSMSRTTSRAPARCRIRSSACCARPGPNMLRLACDPTTTTPIAMITRTVAPSATALPCVRPRRNCLSAWSMVPLIDPEAALSSGRAGS